ncbi:MAG: hypothetical protein M0R17_01925 [Candidatus Omnitrophica bacterium]|jgi:hypothetical protein|nr:hypothetical protein [Candidatus Omnitrophota bacterium]
MPSGKGKSSGNPNGVRRRVGGEILAPKSLRNKKAFERDCTDEELKKAKVKREGESNNG